MTTSPNQLIRDVGLRRSQRQRQMKRGWLIDQQTGDRTTSLSRKTRLQLNSASTVAALLEETAPDVLYYTRLFVIKASVADALEKALREVRREGVRYARVHAEDRVLDVLESHGVEVPLSLPEAGFHAFALVENLTANDRDQFLEDEARRVTEREEQLARVARVAQMG